MTSLSGAYHAYDRDKSRKSARASPSCNFRDRKPCLLLNNRLFCAYLLRHDAVICYWAMLIDSAEQAKGKYCLSVSIHSPSGWSKVQAAFWP